MSPNYFGPPLCEKKKRKEPARVSAKRQQREGRKGLKPPTLEQVKAFQEKQRVNAKARGPIKQSNAKVSARKTANYRKGLAAYKRSETHKIVEARAGGRCEFSPPMWGFEAGVIRCPNRRGEEGVKLHHHHLTYARFGGDELPSDIRVLCAGHHEHAEANARPWNRRKYVAGRRSVEEG